MWFHGGIVMICMQYAVHAINSTKPNNFAFLNKTTSPIEHKL